MAVNLKGFLDRFNPEFQTVSSDKLETLIAEQDASTSDGWASEEQRDEYVYLRVADGLARQPTGRNARKEYLSETPYTDRLRCIELAHAWAHRRIF